MRHRPRAVELHVAINEISGGFSFFLFFFSFSLWLLSLLVFLFRCEEMWQKCVYTNLFVTCDFFYLDVCVYMSGFY